MLQASSVSVRFGGVTALDKVSLSIDRGHVVGLIGPNGAGKSTLVNVFTGLQRVSEGAVLLDKGDITRDAAHRRARRGIARTFQAARLFANLTVEENVALPAIAHGMPDIAPIVADLLDWLEIGHLGPKTGGALSYADERKVGIARALAARPQYVLMDEPAAGMSEPDAEYLAGKIRECPRRFGCGVLLIEHNIKMVVSACDHVMVLNFGEVLAEGAPADILVNEAVIAAYLGETD